LVFLLLQQFVYCDAKPIGFKDADNVPSVLVLREFRHDHYILSAPTACKF
jgi:hypothetical protein